MPGIVLLLLLGVALGPDGLDVVRPGSIGEGLPMLVELAVAVILFEGALNLNLGRIRREARTIRSLITTGALVTGAGGALAVRATLGWDWPTAILFGSLVIVTGPTVITPLLRRIQVKKNLHTILEAEGVLIDPIGAIVAVVALEIVVGGADGAAAGPYGVLVRLAVGALIGALGGLAIAGLLRNGRFVPDQLQNILALSMALATFELSNAFQPESGLMAVVAAGMVVGNLQTRLHRELLEFKEQLTVMLVGMLFVLLAADVRVEEVAAVGWAGMGTIVILMFVVRPLSVAASTLRSGLSLKEKAFLSWLSPRGIVAAAVASLFAQSLGAHGMEGGPELRALVFMVIATTVIVQGLTGGLVASLLGLRKARNDGYTIVGAHALGRTLAEVLRDAGHRVVLVDRNPREVNATERSGLPVVYGDATEENTLLRADLECRRAVIVLTRNVAVNVLVARHARELATHVPALVALDRGDSTFDVGRLAQGGHNVLFGQPVDLERWVQQLRRGGAEVQRWRFEPTDGQPGSDTIWLDEDATAAVLGLVLATRRLTEPVVRGTSAKRGDVLTVCVLKEQRERTEERLAAAGWVPTAPLEN